MRCFLITFLCIFIGACIPYSDNPLTDPNSEKMDSVIYGTWFWKEEHESGYIHVGLDEESKLLRVVMLDIDAVGHLDISEFSGHTSVLGNNKYLNLKWIRPADEVPGYLFVKYTVEGESLAFSLIEFDIVENAIKDGSLKGSIDEDKGGSPFRVTEVHVTEEQKKLQEFVVRNDKELFKEKTHLYRLTLPNKSLSPTAEREG